MFFFLIFCSVSHAAHTFHLADEYVVSVEVYSHQPPQSVTAQLPFLLDVQLRITQLQVASERAHFCFIQCT